MTDRTKINNDDTRTYNKIYATTEPRLTAQKHQQNAPAEADRAEENKTKKEHRMKKNYSF